MKVLESGALALVGLFSFVEVARAFLVDWENNHNELSLFNPSLTSFADDSLKASFLSGESSTAKHFASRSLASVASLATDKSELDSSFALLGITVTVARHERTAGDWLGVYLDGDDPSATAPIRYVPLMRVFPDYNESAASSFRVNARLVNMRRPYRVAVSGWPVFSC